MEDFCERCPITPEVYENLLAELNAV